MNPTLYYRRYRIEMYLLAYQHGGFGIDFVGFAPRNGDVLRWWRMPGAWFPTKEEAIQGGCEEVRGRIA